MSGTGRTRGRTDGVPAFALPRKSGNLGDDEREDDHHQDNNGGGHSDELGVAHHVGVVDVGECGRLGRGPAYPRAWRDRRSWRRGWGYWTRPGRGRNFNIRNIRRLVRRLFRLPWDIRRTPARAPAAPRPSVVSFDR